MSGDPLLALVLAGLVGWAAGWWLSGQADCGDERCAVRRERETRRAQERERRHDLWHADPINEQLPCPYCGRRNREEQ